MEKDNVRIHGLYHNRTTCEIAVLGIIEHEDMTRSWFINSCFQHDSDDINEGFEQTVFEHTMTVDQVKQFLRDRGLYPMNPNVILVPKHLVKNFEGDLIFWEHVARTYGMEYTSIMEYDSTKIYQNLDLNKMHIPWNEHHWVWYENLCDPCLEFQMKKHEAVVLRIAHYLGQKHLFRHDGLIEEI